MWKDAGILAKHGLPGLGKPAVMVLSLADRFCWMGTMRVLPRKFRGDFST